MIYENGYIENLQGINKNLRDQIENLFKLLKIKIKIEYKNENNRFENILNELEILKSSLSFMMQKQTNIVSKNKFNFNKRKYKICRKYLPSKFK